MIDEMAGVWRKDAGDTKSVELWECRVESYKSSPVQLLLLLEHVK